MLTDFVVHSHLYFLKPSGWSYFVANSLMLKVHIFDILSNWLYRMIKLCKLHIPAICVLDRLIHQVHIFPGKLLQWGKMSLMRKHFLRRGELLLRILPHFYQVDHWIKLLNVVKHLLQILLFISRQLSFLFE